MSHTQRKKTLRLLLLVVPLFFAIASTISTATIFMVEHFKGNSMSFWAVLIIVAPLYIILAVCLWIRKKI
ncbi:hypothetical protein GA0061087_104030 [Priestia flexa]|nr:hypothetical protein GA0061087_104030 [Priestia flexa]